MKHASFNTLPLQAYLALNRFGWINCAVIALALFALAIVRLGMPLLIKSTNAPVVALEQVKQQLNRFDSGNAIIRPPLPQERLTAFYDTLGDFRYSEQQVRTLFAIASKNGLILKQAEYKSGVDRNSHTYSYQIILPVQGSYSAIRQFCEQTLLTIPFASLDEITFKREAISSRTLEAKLRLTLFLLDRRHAGEPAIQQISSHAGDEP